MKKQLLMILCLAISSLVISAQDVYIKLDVEGSALKNISKEFQEGDQFESLILRNTIDYTSNSGYARFKNVVSLVDKDGES